MIKSVIMMNLAKTCVLFQTKKISDYDESNEIINIICEFRK